MTNNNSYNEERLCVAGDTGELEKIRLFIELKARETGFNEQGAFNIALAVDEACSNLIRHSYRHDSSKTLCIGVARDNQSLTVCIYDTGDSFNPLNVPSPNMKEYFQKYLHGGLGVHLIRTLIDQIEYIPADPAHPFNILKLVKTLH